MAGPETAPSPTLGPLDLYKKMLALENQDQAKADYRVAYAYRNGTQGVTPDREIALEYALGSSVLGDARAMFLAGMVYYDRKDYESAYDWFAQSAEWARPTPFACWATCITGAAMWPKTQTRPKSIISRPRV